jgi:hypothetical protein
MADDGIALMEREYRAARRLARLFRIERSDRFERWPNKIIRRLLDRRSCLIDELLRLDEKRRSRGPSAPAELDLAMGALAQEVGRAERHCLNRVAALEAELDRRRDRRRATGLRDGAAGQLLGRG